MFDAQQPTDYTNGYYDLYYDRPDFHGDYWVLGDKGYIGATSVRRPMTPTP
ncbi:hypothetical protein ACWECR_00285 [Streptomyces sp. NPDC005056]